MFDEGDRCGCAVDSLISAGCIISGARVNRSVVFFGTTVDDYSLVENCVVLPKVTIGKRCRITNTIIDKGCVIPDGMVIGEDPRADGKKFHITPNGIRLVTPTMLNQNLYELEEPLID